MFNTLEDVLLAIERASNTSNLFYYMDLVDRVLFMIHLMLNIILVISTRCI